MGSITILTIYMIPFMPQNPIFTALIGGFVAILGYRLPMLSALTVSIVMTTSMLFQLTHAGFLTFLYRGDLGLIIFLWMACVLFGGLSVDVHESLAAFSLGYLAFLLLFTSFWYLAIPIIILPSVLSRRFRVGFATIMFILPYLPFQIAAYAVNNLGDLAQISSSTFANMRPAVLASLNPPFDPTNKGVQTVLGFMKPFDEPLSKLTMDEFITKLGVIPNALGGGSESFFGLNLMPYGVSTYDIYSNTMLIYLNNIGSMMLLIVAISLSISLAYVTFKVLTRFKPQFQDPFRELVYSFFESIIGAIVGMALFIGLFSGLADTLNYASPFLQSFIHYTTMGFVIFLTALPSSVKAMLEYSDMKSKLQEGFLKLLREYEDDILKLKAFLNKLNDIDREIGIVVLKKSLETLSAKITSFSIKVSRLDLKNLQDLRESVDLIGEEVEEAKHEAMEFTGDYIIERIKLLRETTLWTLERAWLREDDDLIKALDKFDESQSMQSMDEIENLLVEIIDVADTLTHRLMSLHEETRVTLQNIFQVESRLRIDIEQSIIRNIEVTMDEGKVWTALQIICKEIEDMEATYSDRVKALRSRLTHAVESLKKDADKLVHNKLKPLIGKRFNNFLRIYDDITTVAKEDVGGVISVIGLRKILDNTREQALDLTKTTYELIEVLQSDGSRKSPVDFRRLTRLSNIGIGSKKSYTEIETSLAMETKSGEEVISDLENVLRKDSLGLLKLLLDYAILYERILNYPNAEAMILSILKEREKVSIEDLPFARKHSLWYMRLYALQHRSFEVKSDKERYTLTKRER